MTDNDKLLAWQDNGSTPNIASPDYLNDDAAAMSLLDTLVEKGYIWFLGVDTDELREICKVRHKDSTASINKYADTRREAVVAACLEVARKELEG